MPSTTLTEDELETHGKQLLAEFELAERKGQPILQKLAPEIAALGLPRGSYIFVNIDNGEYVAGPSRRAARPEFRRRYPDTIAWGCRIEDLPRA